MEGSVDEETADRNADKGAVDIEEDVNTAEGDKEPDDSQITCDSEEVIMFTKGEISDWHTQAGIPQRFKMPSESQHSKATVEGQIG